MVHALSIDVDVVRSQRAIEDAIGRPVLGYRAPHF
jgi:hypothetical protein